MVNILASNYFAARESSQQGLHVTSTVKTKWIAHSSALVNQSCIHEDSPKCRRQVNKTRSRTSSRRSPRRTAMPSSPPTRRSTAPSLRLSTTPWQSRRPLRACRTASGMRTSCGKPWRSSSKRRCLRAPAARTGS